MRRQCEGCLSTSDGGLLQSEPVAPCGGGSELMLNVCESRRVDWPETSMSGLVASMSGDDGSLECRFQRDILVKMTAQQQESRRCISHQKVTGGGRDSESFAFGRSGITWIVAFAKEC